MKIKPRMEIDNIKYYGVEDLNTVCPICKKNDWCVIAEHGYHAVCGRIKSPRMMGQSGYLHPCLVNMGNIEPACNTVKPNINWNSLQNLYRDMYLNLNPVPQFILDVEQEFGIQPLEDFKVGYDGEALTIPAWGNGEIVGMFRRFPDGSKRMLKGSSLGLVDNLRPNPSGLTICEGFTDTIAVHRHVLGHRVVGRASCNTGKEYISLLLQKINPNNVTIIADNDKPGLDGAMELFKFLTPHSKGFKLRVYRPENGFKDIREAIREKGKLAFNRAVLMELY